MNLKKREITEEDLYKFTAIGCGPAQLAAYYGMGTQAFYEYCSQRPNLWHAMKLGEFEGAATVQGKAYEMAVSGEHPNMTMFWLKTKCGFREEPIFSFIVENFQIKDPRYLKPSDAQTVYNIACETLKEKEQTRELQYAQKGLRKRKYKQSKNLEQHLANLKEKENG